MLGMDEIDNFNTFNNMQLELDKIYLGDCLELMKEIPRGHKYCVVTDPPFNIGYHYKDYDDRMDEGKYFEWLSDIVRDYPCCIIHYPEALYKFSFQIGEFPERVVSWVYNSNTPRQHRDAAYFRVKPDFNLVIQPYKNPTDKRIASRIESGIGGGQMLRLDGSESSEERKQKVNGKRSYAPMPDAGRSDEAFGRYHSRRLCHRGPIHGQWYDSNSSHSQQTSFYRFRDRQRLSQDSLRESKE